MGNISGIVTDTSGIITLSGAVVQLEKSGQMVTTGTDGHFMLASTSIFNKSKQQPQSSKLFAKINNGRLSIKVKEKLPLEIKIYTIHGKSISKNLQTIDAGIHHFLLPHFGAGTYLCIIKWDNNEVILKYNSFGGVSGSTGATQSLFFNGLVKEAKVTAVIDDVIKVKKQGYLNCRIKVTNSDTNGIEIKMIEQDAGTLTDIDGNVYHAIRIGYQVWTVENFRGTKYNDGTLIFHEPDSIQWDNLAIPAYCYYNNTTNTDSIKKFGALYNWYAIDPENPKKIAPVGWHVPSGYEWITLKNYLIANGYSSSGTTDTAIAKSMAAKIDWHTSTISGAIGNDLNKNNESGFSALGGGYRGGSRGKFDKISDQGIWWSTTTVLCDPFGRCVWILNSNSDITRLGDCWVSSNGFSLRLVKDSVRLE